MNNKQFRRLVFDNPENQNGSESSANASAVPSNLGTRKSSFMPMTPRAVKGGIDVDFARQVRERNAALRPSKTFKSATPKGVKYGAGYTDRTKARADAEEAEGDDGKAERIKALEEQMKLGQISEELFVQLRDEITGGEIGSTHLVKGLDRRLLERVRRGEDVLGGGGGSRERESDSPEYDVDEMLDKLNAKQVDAPKKKTKTQKKGVMAPPPPVAGTKRSRDEIMAELKAQRKAAADAKAAPALDASKWRKVGEQKSRIEIDSKGREVLITVDEDGVVKKKVRKIPGQETEQKAAMAMPDASQPVLGADTAVPAIQQPVDEEDEDDDIFEGVGAEYNPLGDDEDDESGEESEESEESETRPTQPVKEAAKARSPSESVEDEDEKPVTATRNYFKDAPSTQEEPDQDRMTGVQDFLKRASKMDSAALDGDDEEGADAQKAREKRRAEMLAQQDRDLEDMDMGFGGSRYEYDEGEDDEGGGKKVRLSEWKGSGGGHDDGDDGGEKQGGKKKTRKPKKRKGDVNNISDIMRVIDGRKAAGGS